MSLRKDIIRWFKGFGKDAYSKKEDYVFDTTPDWLVKHLNYTLIQEWAPILKGRILDLGCNHGLMAIHLARRGETVTGIDLNIEALKKAQAFKKAEAIETQNRVFFMNAFFQHMPFKEQTFDAAIMFDVFEHLYEHDRAAILGEVKRVLKPLSRLFVVSPLDHYYDSHAHVSFFSQPAALEKALTEHGFIAEAVVLDERTDFHGDPHHRINAVVINP